MSEAAANPSVVSDYSDQLQQIAQLVAYADLALVVLTVIAAVGIGALVGSLVTRWLNGR